MDSSEAIKVQYKNKNDLEILVKPDEALAYRNGEIDSFEKVLFVREIFTDAGAAEKAGADTIKDEFGTKNVLEAAEKLFQKGKMELTTEQKSEIREEKRKKLVNLIARRAMNPKTGNPHPPKRIENALEEAGVHVDPMKTAEEQFEGAVDKIKPKLPISLEDKELAVKIPNKYAGKCYGKLKNLANVEDEEWGDQAFMAKVTLPAGAKEELVEALNKVCHGDLEIKDL
ncbi:MAG: ribosome assembly factor SBDS [Candidatus Nanohaloarchaea archaeon]|nr:ribosome assembly factor SBDS [Candidatus Nanohaloarchaea archaeon]